MRARRCILVLAALAFAWGCGSNNGLNLARVRGRVTYKGEPVKYGTVHFMPSEDKGTKGPPALGVITSDGSYVLSTDEPGDGALVGSHRVGITGLDPTPINAEPAPEPDKAPVDVMKTKERTARKSRGSARKQQGDTFTDRGGRTFRFVTPKGVSDPNSSGIAVEVSRGSNRFDFEVGEDGNVRVRK
jgi:hypothetical protein